MDTGKILSNLPIDLRNKISELPNMVMENLEEIRIRVNHKPIIYSMGKNYEVNLNVSQDLLNNTFNKIVNYSYYAYEEDLANGFITMEGGHRVGVCGKVINENGKIKLISNISSLNIRKSREIHGISDKLMKHIITNKMTKNLNRSSSMQILNTLIVSPPKCGKTTLLRDIVRNISNEGFKVCVCDERSEIAGSYLGKTSYDLGRNTDILDNCPKSKGIVMLIRAMSPDVIATDEIGKKEDVWAIEAAACAGVSLITTIHGNSMEDVYSSGIGECVKNGFFQKIFFMSQTPKTGTIKEILTLPKYQEQMEDIYYE